MGRVEYGLARGQDRVRLPEVDYGRRQQAQAPVVMLVVLPMNELAAEVQGVLEAGEAVGELRPVLQRLELALREGIKGLSSETCGWLWDLVIPNVARS